MIVKRTLFVLWTAFAWLVLGLVVFLLLVFAVDLITHRAPVWVAWAMLGISLIGSGLICNRLLLAHVDWESPFAHIRWFGYVVIFVPALGLTALALGFLDGNLIESGLPVETAGTRDPLPPIPGYPIFPLPGFPNPSSYYAIHATHFGQMDELESALSYGQVGLVVAHAAERAGFPGIRYYNQLSPLGVNLVAMTDLERIDTQGVRATVKAFDLEALNTIQNFTISEYLRYLFTAPQGRYRFIIVVISDEPPIITDQEPTRELAENLLGGAVPFIDDLHFGRGLTQQTIIHFLIYEFIKPQGHEPRFLGPGRLPAELHLTGSGFANHLNLIRQN